MNRPRFSQILLFCGLLFLMSCQPPAYRILQAIETGQQDAVRDMLEKGVPADEVPEGDHRLPLEVAAQANQPEIVQMLISYGAHPDSASEGSPLWTAIAADANAAAIALVEAGANLEKPLLHRQTPLVHALVIRNHEVAQAMIRKGAELNPVEPLLRPLGEAIYAENLETVALMLEKGANPSLLTNEYEPPITVAFQLADLSMAKLLLEKGADINETDEDGRNLAFWLPRITAKNLKEAVSMGLDINAKDNYGDTALHSAIDEIPADQLKQVLQHLLEAGADPGIRNAKGLTAGRAAQAAGKSEIEALLIE